MTIHCISKMDLVNDSTLTHITEKVGERKTNRERQTNKTNRDRETEKKAKRKMDERKRQEETDTEREGYKLS